MIKLNRKTGVLILLRTLFTENPWTMLVAAGTMTISSFVQGFGIALLAPLLSLIGFQGPTTTGRMAKIISTILHSVGLPMTIPTVLLLFLSLVVIENIIKYFEMTYSQRFIINFAEQLRNTLFKAYLQADWPFWLQKRIGPMAGLLTEENLRVESTLNTILAFLSNLILMAVLLGVAFVFSWPMALIFLVSGGLLILIIEARTLRRSPQTSVNSQATEVQEVVHEHLSAAKLIKSSGLVTQSLKIFQTAVRQLHDVQYKKWRQAYKSSSIFNPLIVSILCLGFYCAVGPLHIPQSKALVILLIYFRLAARLSGTRDMGHGILLFSPSYEAILRDIREATKHTEQNQSQKRHVLAPLSQDIEFRQLSFSYLPGTPVLSNISLGFKAKTTSAIVAESGGGKSTLLDLMVGLLTPEKGEILIDGCPLNEADLNQWREQIGYVNQDTILFNDTVSQNIRWANPNATEADIEKAARMAQAHEFIQQLPNGYRTIVGSRGVRLSGGEKQRIALARALVRQPRLLILDEATSALDGISETLIQGAIEELRHQMTIVMVTHRLSTIRSADVIYVLEDGRLVEKGTWDELLGHTGPFKRMCKTQEK